MITFLNSIIFTLAFAVLIPLLIHLFNRQRRTKKPFSSIRFLKMLEKQRLNRINIYQYLLIIIRTLIVALLIIAFARPTLITDIIPARNAARTTAVIILDTGLNMRYYDDRGMRFDRAIITLKKVLELFKPEDQVFLLLTHQAKKTGIDSVIIDAIKCSYLHVNRDNVISATIRILKSYANYNQEVFLISDNINMAGTFSAIKEQISDVRPYIFQIGDQSFNNISIDSLYFVNDLFEPLQPIELQVSLYNAGLVNAEDTEIHLYVNDKREAYSRTTIAPGEKIPVPLSFQPKDFGFIRGYVEIGEDALDADNRYYFNLRIPEKVDILFVEQNSSIFLESALKTIDRNSNVNIKFARYEQWGVDNFNKYHKIFLSNFSAIEGLILTRLNNYLKAGGRLILMPGYNSTPSDINHLLNEIDSDIRVINLSAVTGSDNYYKLEIHPRGHPILGNLFRTSDTKINSPHFSRYFQVRANSKIRQLLAFSNRDPFILYEKNKNGFIYFFTSYIDETWTDIQFKGIFVPMLTRILSSDNYGFDQGMNSIEVGTKFDLILKQDERTGNYSLVTPDNINIKLIPDTFGMTQVLSVDYLNSPGNYSVLNAERTIAVLSANISSGELSVQSRDHDPENYDDLPAIFPEDEEFKDTIIEARSGRELWKLFIILAILFIISEFIIIKKIEK